MRYWIAILLLFVLPTARAGRDKPSCTAKELAGKDCRLIQGHYNLRLLPKTVAWSDGTWQAVDDMPLKGEAVAWDKVTFTQLNGWPLLQLWLWDKGEGELQVQSLHWLVGAAEERKITWLAEGIVRKRRPETESPSVPRFLYDKWETFSLQALKNGDLEWHLSDEKKIIAKKQVQHGI